MTARSGLISRSDSLSLGPLPLNLHRALRTVGPSRTLTRVYLMKSNIHRVSLGANILCCWSVLLYPKLSSSDYLLIPAKEPTMCDMICWSKGGEWGRARVGPAGKGPFSPSLHETESLSLSKQPDLAGCQTPGRRFRPSRTQQPTAKVSRAPANLAAGTHNCITLFSRGGREG